MYPDSNLNLNYETDDAVYWFSTAFEPFNNWSAHAVEIWNKRFPTAEHAYHYRKFSEHAPAIAEEIRKAPSPWAAMRLERTYREHRRPDWQKMKEAVMLEIVRAKAAQNDDMRACLLATGDKKLVENSPWDNFWGCGENGKGRNVMGKILMRIRDELRASVER